MLPALTSAQGALVSAFARLVAGTPAEATTGELVSAVHDLHHLDAVLAGAGHRWLSRWEASMDWACDGARSPAAWLSVNAEVSRERAATGLKTARVLLDLPVIADAARAGRLGPEKVRLLLGARTDDVRAVFDAQEAYLVDTVAGLTVAATRLFLDRWRQHALAETGTDDADIGGDTSGVHLSVTWKGRLRVDGDLDAEHGAIVKGAVDAEIDTWFRAGLLNDDPRTRAQLNAAALAAVCAHYGHTGTTGGAPRPLLIGLVDIDTLLRNTTTH